MNDEQKRALQEKLLELELLKNQAQGFQEQLTIVLESLSELTTTKVALDEMNAIDKGVLVPLGPDVYVRANVSDRKNVLVHVGANIVMRKSTKYSKKILQGHLDRLENNRSTIENNLKKISQAMEMLQKDIQSMATAIKADEQV